MRKNVSKVNNISSIFKAPFGGESKEAVSKLKRDSLIFKILFKFYYKPENSIKIMRGNFFGDGIIPPV
jgi:hypothetical protein